MRVKVGIDTEGLDLGFSVVVDAVKRALQFNQSLDFVIYTLDSNKADLEKILPNYERIIIKTSPESAHPGLQATDIIRDLQDDLENENRKFKYTMSNAIYDSILKKIDVCIIPGHAGHLAVIARHIERHLGVFNPLFPQCFAHFIPTENRQPRLMLDLGAMLQQDLFKLSVLGEHFIRHYAGIENPKIGFLNIGSEETKGPPDIREAAAAYKKYKPDCLYEAGFIEPDKLFAASEDCDVVVCNALHGNLVIKACKGTFKFIESVLRDLGPIFKMVVGPTLKRLLKKNSPEIYSSAIIFGYSSLMLKTHGSANTNAMYSAIQNGIKYRKPFQLFYTDFNPKTAELFRNLNSETQTYEVNESA
jgi:glycerol-3-phosphate acyltransferase PlsX